MKVSVTKEWFFPIVFSEYLFLLSDTLSRYIQSSNLPSWYFPILLVVSLLLSGFHTSTGWEFRIMSRLPQRRSKGRICDLILPVLQWNSTVARAQERLYLGFVSKVYNTFLEYSHIISVVVFEARGWMNEDMMIVSWLLKVFYELIFGSTFGIDKFYISSLPTFIPSLCLSCLPSASKFWFDSAIHWVFAFRR